MKAYAHRFDVVTTEKAIFELIEKASRRLRTEGVSPDQLASCQLALEELLLNFRHHNQLKREDPVTVILASDGRSLSLTIRDRGEPFDPTEAGSPDLSIPHQDRPIGGLGIHLVRETSDRFEYERTDDENVVCVHWNGEAQAN